MDAICGKISSKHFEKLAIGPKTNTLFGASREYDLVIRSFADRLRELGAVKPLTIVVDVEVPVGELDFHHIWPRFSGVGVVVQGDDW